MKNRWNQKSLFAVLNNHLIDYPTPINFNYFYGFGLLAGLMLTIQILTGIFFSYALYSSYRFSF